MEKRKNDVFTEQTAQLVTEENDTQYFVYGNTRIKISEHFAIGGKPLDDLIVDVVRHTAENKASA